MGQGSSVIPMTLDVVDAFIPITRWNYNDIEIIVSNWKPNPSILTSNALTRDELHQLLQVLYRKEADRRNSFEISNDGTSNHFNDSPCSHDLVAHNEIYDLQTIANDPIALAKICKFQSNVRGRITRNYFSPKSNREISLGHENSVIREARCRRQVFAMFDEFCKSANSVNPYRATLSTDAIQVMISLILLCDGRAFDKINLLCRILLCDTDVHLEHGDLMVLLILTSKALSNIFKDTGPIYVLNDSDIFLEEIAESMCSWSSTPENGITAETLYAWILNHRRFAQWISRLSNDVLYREVLMQNARCSVVFNIVDEIHAPLCTGSSSSSNNEIRIHMVNLEDHKPRGILQSLSISELNQGRCFVHVCSDPKNKLLGFASASDCGEIEIHKELCVDSTFARFYEGPSEILSGVPVDVRWSYASDDPMMSWSENDYIGVYDVACPQDTTGEYARTRLYEALYEKRCIRLPDLPSATERLVHFDGGSLLKYVDFASTRFAVIGHVPKRDVGSHVLTPKTPVVVRVNAMSKLPCTCDSGKSCPCIWVLAIVRSGGPGDQYVISCGELHHNKREYTVSSNMVSELVADQVPNHGMHVVMVTKDGVLFSGVVIHSGKLEMRYIKHMSLEPCSYVGIAMSNPFRIKTPTIELGSLLDGSIFEPIICTVSCDPEDIDIAPGGFIGLYPVDHPYIARPFLNLYCKVNRQMLLDGKVVLNNGNFPFPYGGRFEARFVHAKLGRVTSVSKPGLLSPVVAIDPVVDMDSIFRVDYFFPKRNPLECKINIVADGVWSPYDRVELYRRVIPTEDEDFADEPPTCIYWCYMTHPRMIAKCVEYPLDNVSALLSGIFEWRYHGAHPRLRESSKPFKIIVQTKLEAEEEYARRNNWDTLNEEDRQAKEELRSHGMAQRIQTRYRSHRAWRSFRELRSSILDRRTEVALSIQKLRQTVKALEIKIAKTTGTVSRRDDRQFKRGKQQLAELEAEQVALLRVQMNDSTSSRDVSTTKSSIQMKDDAYNRGSLRVTPFEAKENRRLIMLDNATEIAAPIDSTELAEMMLFAEAIFEDDQFPATLVSVLGEHVEEDSSWVPGYLSALGPIDWRRLADLYIHPRGMPDILVEHMNTGKIGLLQRDDIDQAHRRNMEPLHFALRVFAEANTTWMHSMLDFEHASLGFFTVNLFWHGKWHSVIVDDRFPCIRGIPPFSTPDPHDVGAWVLVVEKALAKLHGSYRAFFGANFTFQEIFSMLTGGFPATFRCLPNDKRPDATLRNKVPDLGRTGESVSIGLSPLSRAGNFAELSKMAVHVTRHNGEVSHAKDPYLSSFASHCYIVASSVTYGCCRIIDHREITLKYRKTKSALRPIQRGEAEDPNQKPHTPVVTLLKLQKLVDKEYDRFTEPWRGEWNNECSLWNDKEVRPQVTEMEFSDDGAFWISMYDFSNNFDSWGWVQILDDRKLTSLVTEIPFSWVHSKSTNIDFVAGGQQLPWSKCNPTVKVESQATEIVVIVENTQSLDEIRVVDWESGVDAVVPKHLTLQTLLVPRGEATLCGQLSWPFQQGSCQCYVISLGNANVHMHEVHGRDGELVVNKELYNSLVKMQQADKCVRCCKTFTEQQPKIQRGVGYFHKACGACDRCKKKFADMVTISTGSSLVFYCGICWEGTFGENPKKQVKRRNK